MSTSRAFLLLLGLALGGAALLVAAAIRLTVGVWPEDSSVHGAIDGICVFAPVHGDILSHAVSYGAALLLLGVAGLAVRYVGHQVMASRALGKEIGGLGQGIGDPRLNHLILSAGISARVRLIESPRRAAFTAGLLRPSIYLTRGLVASLPDKQLEAVLLHEEHHARRMDPLRIMLANAAGRVLFFLPLLRDLASFLDTSKEVEADAAAVRRQGSKAHVAAALCALAGLNVSTVSPAVGFHQGDTVAARIDALTSGRWQGRLFSGPGLGWSLLGVLMLAHLVAFPFISAHGAWAVVVSLGACPAWVVLYWAALRRA